jgi:putative transposase
MPWRVSGAMEQRMRFVMDHETGLFSMSDLCARYETSRQTGYKWLDRYRLGGVESLRDGSRAPKRSPQRMEPAIEALLLEARQAHPTWGPRKIGDGHGAIHSVGH